MGREKYFIPTQMKKGKKQKNGFKRASEENKEKGNGEL